VAVDPGVVVVLPERDSSDVRCLRRRVRDKASSSGVEVVKTFRARRGSVVGEAWKGPVEFLAPGDAYQLYKRLHRARLLVISFTTVFVRRDPSRDPAVRKEALALSTFVEHKADFELVRGASSINDTFDRFAASLAQGSCEGEDDPRCLPLHVFTTDRLWPQLREEDGRRAFRKRYGPPRERSDDRGRRWARADRGAFHGREALVIAGCELAAGMHWDVTGGRGPAGRLTTANEVWKLGRQGYVNVHPDAHVSASDRSTARRVWTDATGAKRSR
jgi:hypothetical protein